MNMISDKTVFSDYLKAKRLAAKLSQQKLADKISALGYTVSNGKISYYETNAAEKKGWTGRPPEDFLPYLSQALNLDLNEVRREAGYSSTEESTPSIPLFLYQVKWKLFDLEDIKDLQEFIDFKVFQKLHATPFSDKERVKFGIPAEQEVFEEFSETELLDLIDSNKRRK